MSLYLLLFILITTLNTSSGQNEKPSWTDYNPQNKDIRNEFGQWLLTGGVGELRKTDVEFPPYDGWYNNLARPDSGAIDKPLLRRVPADYEDGTYLPSGRNRPNPLDLSDALLNGMTGTSSRTGKNALLVFFGQQVVEEILDAQRPACPPEYFNIDIPESHRYRNLTKHSKLPLLRTRFDHRTGLNPNNPRQQLNEITPYLDGGLIYGITKQWSDQLRTYRNGSLDKNGLLAHSEDGLFPENNTHRLPMANPPPPFYHSDFIKNHELLKVDRFFKLGNPRGNENTFLLTFGVLWFRWHNYLARNIKLLRPTWDGEEIFNEARKWVIASQQRIVFYEWLPSWLNGTIPDYVMYDPSIDPQIDQFFQTAAFRFGHTLVTPGVYMRDYGRNGCNYTFNDILGTNAVRTCNSFWRPQEAILKEYSRNGDKVEYMDIDRLLMGMAYQLCEEEDHTIVEDLRQNVFGPLEFPRRDLMAVNVQRGRDHGVPDFNSARRAYGLHEITSFNHFNRVNATIKARLEELYDKNVNNIDLWIGGILETTDGPGELFEAIILDQFRRIRDGDRFWYQNRQNKLFTNEELQRLERLRLYDIIMAVTKMDVSDIPPMEVFRVPPQNSVPYTHSNCTEKMVEKQCRQINKTAVRCFHLPILNDERLNESCKQGTSYDYFSNSEASFILTFAATGAFIVGLIGLIYTLIFVRDLKVRNSGNSETAMRRNSLQGSIIMVKEWVGPNSPSRNILLHFNDAKAHLEITSVHGTLLRSIHFNKSLTYFTATGKSYLIVKPMNEYDLVLRFETDTLRQRAIQDLCNFAGKFGQVMAEENDGSLSYKEARKLVVTKEHRQTQLEMFFRVVVAQAFRIPLKKKELFKVDSDSSADVINMELTLEEFADVLSMPSNNTFATLMFKWVDKDQNGFISFRELVDLIVIFAQGTARQKAELLFNMYDIDQVRFLSKDTFKEMMSSFLETTRAKISGNSLEDIINNFVPNKERITFEDFWKIMEGYGGVLEDAKLGFKYPTHFKTMKEEVEDIYGNAEEIKRAFKTDVDKLLPPTEVLSGGGAVANNLISLIQKYSLEIFWMTLYTLVLLAIFAERSYYYTVEREHSGLRMIAGLGVTVTRGAASAMMFTYSSLLVTMCRNLNTVLRDTVANKYFPFDSSVEFHKYIAYWGLFFTILHIIGHAFNFYHICTQTADDLTCLFRNYFHATHELPKFHYWAWQTLTGVTGIILTLVTATIYAFSQSIVRRKLHNHFFYTHSLYSLFYVLMILHGSGRLIQQPFFYYFFLGPLILFAIDQMFSLSRRKVEIAVVDVKILPSNVTYLEIERPSNFEYKSGQWVRIACLGLNHHEYHPFTLSSSPDEPNITLHIRAVGPWTHNIRKLYGTAMDLGNELPRIYLDGPFGEGHQDWHQYEVSILIGGGIGVTPFASILKDIVYSKNSKVNTKFKKIYFIWVSKTQKQFEWLVDLLKEVEEKDEESIISTHIYITEFYEKFDLRTVMLYVFERHYQKISNKSLFTNLEAVTHFGRPDFKKLFRTIQDLHSELNYIGVFSCGSPQMISSVDSSCIKINQQVSNRPNLAHHFKTF